MAEARLVIDTRQYDGLTEILCEGEVDCSSVSALVDAIRSRCVAERVRVVRLDMTQVVFIDSAGLAGVVDAARRCRALGVGFEWVPGERVAIIMELCGISAETLDQQISEPGRSI